MGAYVKMHGVPKSGEGEVKIARCENDADEEVYQCTGALAEMVGIDLEV